MSEKDKIRDAAASVVFSEETLSDHETADFLKDLDESKASAFIEEAADSAFSSKREEPSESTKDAPKPPQTPEDPPRKSSFKLHNKQLGALLLLLLVLFIGYEVGYDAYSKFFSQSATPLTKEDITDVKLVNELPPALANAVSAANDTEAADNTTELNATATKPTHPLYVTKSELSEFTEQIMGSMTAFRESITDLKEAIKALEQKNSLLEAKLSKISGIESAVGELSLETKDISKRLKQVETKLSNESRKLQEVYSKFREKKKRVRIVDSYTVEINNVLYTLGDIIKIRGKKFIIVSIDKKKGVYLKDSQGNKWLLKS